MDYTFSVNLSTEVAALFAVVTLAALLAVLRFLD